MGSVYLRSSDQRWVAAVSRGPRGSRRTTIRYAASEDEARRFLAAMEPSPDPWAKVDRTGDCWLWTGPRSRGGYGMFWDGERNRIASRYIYEREVAPIPEGMDVLHRCDNPPCVRPDHLFPGTAADNVADMIAKGRHRARRPAASSSLVVGPADSAS